MKETRDREERRGFPRTNTILPGRFRPSPEGGRKRAEKAKWSNSHLSNISQEGFCLAMPENLEPSEIIEFEYYYRGKTIAGKAKIAWMDSGKSMAGCFILEYFGEVKEEQTSNQ